MQLLKGFCFLLFVGCCFCACSSTVSSDEDTGVNGIAGFHPSGEVYSDSTSDSVPFSRGDSILTDSRDGQTYKVVKIGTQIWMAENLNYRYLEKTAELDSSSFCFDNDPENCEKFGRLYPWSAAMDSAGTGNGCGRGVTCSQSSLVKGICPDGWHLPTREEFKVLETTVGGSREGGKKLKSRSGWKDGGNGTDDYGFNAVPSGSLTAAANFKVAGDRTSGVHFWSSTEENADQAYFFGVLYNTDFIYFSGFPKKFMYSIRCIKGSK